MDTVGLPVTISLIVLINKSILGIICQFIFVQSSRTSRVPARPKRGGIQTEVCTLNEDKTPENLKQCFIRAAEQKYFGILFWFR